MPDTAVSTPGSFSPERITAIRARFDREGINVSEWARQRDFSPKLVHQVLSGRRRCRRGESYRIAVALGLKPRTGTDG